MSQTTGYAYDHDGRMICETDPDGAGPLTSPVTSYSYDHDRREITVTDPLSGVTTYVLDADGNETSVTDSDSNTTSYTYDHLNRMTGDTDAASHSDSYSYNADGELTSQTDKDGRVSNFAYDNDGNMTQEQWMSGGMAIYTATYAYDAASLVTSAADNNSDYAYTYNADNSLTQVDNSGTPTGPHVVINVGYDNLQRETSESATVAGTADFLNNYSYDADGQLTEITQQGQSGGNSVAAKLVDLTYTSTGELSTINRYANLTGTQLVVTSTYGYDSNGNATSLSTVQGATTLASYTWTYDHIGRLTADTIGTVSDSYTYDATGQETAATHSGGGNESSSYDANGNRTNTGDTTTTDNELSSDGTYNYTYDNAGNLTKKTTIATGAYVTYTWDYHNRLTDVESYNSSNVLQSHEHYTYDVFDRMIEKQTDPTGGGTYTIAQSFIYDAYSPPLSKGGAGGVGSTGVAGTNIALVYNGSGVLTDRILNGPGADDALADENGSGTVSWLLADREGTIEDVAQYNSGTGVTSVVDHLTYDSFGNITAQTNSADQPLFAYTGELFDSSTGLYYDHARWYDPHTGRFISQDPTGFGGGDVNLYRYVGNSPMNGIDPTGLDGQNPNGSGAGTAAAQPATQSTGQSGGAGAAAQPITRTGASSGGSGSAGHASAEPGFWAGYWRYLTNPSQMDSGLKWSFYGAGGIALAAGAAAGGLAIAGGAGAAGGTAGGGAAATGVGTGAGATGAGVGAAGVGGAAVTGSGMTQVAIMKAFFTGQTLAQTPETVAALVWYLQVATNTLNEYQAAGYTGPGVATQIQRIQQILQQLAQWGIN